MAQAKDCTLYSSHLAAVYKRNHSFIDPNLWYSEDELRKQLESFASAFVLTAPWKPVQEAGLC